jgi:succinate dehydrogenase/fumarate reductase cytochrome b subunit (b558 family)
MDPTKSNFKTRKLHSLLGVLPLGAFILEHLYTNGFVLGGQLAYDRQVNWLLSFPKPVLWTLEIVFIALPLLFHGLLGVKIAVEGKSNVGDYPYARNVGYALQRLSGIYLLGFIVYHVWTTRFSGHFEFPAMGPAVSPDGRPIGHAAVGEGAALVGAKSSIYYFMLEHLSGNWLVGLVYVLGVLAATFHFANGLWTFCITWGITVGARAQKISKIVFNALGAALLVVGVATVVHLVTRPNPFKG